MAPSRKSRGGGSGKARRNPQPARGRSHSRSQATSPSQSLSRQGTPVIDDTKDTRTPAPYCRLKPNLALKIHEGASFQRSRAYVQRFCEGELNVENFDSAKNFLRAIIRQSGEEFGTENCVKIIGESVHGIFKVTEALKYEVKDVAFLNDYVGQLFLFLTYLMGAEESESNTIAFDDHIRRIISRIVTDNAPLLRQMFKATKSPSGKLNADSIEGFARFLMAYLESSSELPPHIQCIITDRMFLDALVKAKYAGVQEIGQKLTYWLDCDAPSPRPGAPGKNSNSPGGRHDNDFQDYRKIKILPTPDELACMRPSCVRKSGFPFKHKGNTRVGIHLDTQFRLLREEMVNEIRADYHEYIQGKTIGPKPRLQSERSKLILQNLQWNNWDFECGPKNRKFGIRLHLPGGFESYMKPGAKKYHELLSDDQNFPYKNNQIACLVVNDEVLGFTKLARDVQSLKEDPPAIILTFEGEGAIRFIMTKLWVALMDQNEGDPDIKLICVDTPVYAHEPVLKRLQAMRTIPLAEELLNFEKGKQIAKTTFYPDNLLHEIVPETSLKNHLKSGDASMTMDKAQCVAIKNALQNKVSLIQGPPGTGKTMVGNVIAKLLYLYTDESMLVITHQNHICDEFLENLLGMGINPEHVVRLGSQYSKATRFVSVNELSDESHLFESVKDAIHSIERHVEAAWNMVEEAIQQLFFQPMAWNDVRELAIRYNGNLEHPQDHFGYLSAFTVPKDYAEFFLNVDPKATVLTDAQLFGLWAEDAECPEGMADYMTDEGKELWDMRPRDRKVILSWFKEATMKDQMEGLVNAAMIFNQQIDELNRWKETRFRYLFKEKRVIAATTNGAAKYLSAIAEAAPKILIVEEAAQILESHVLAALHGKIEKIVMIGDQKQLRPRCETWEYQHDSERGYDFDISLFERLVNAGFPCDVLETQHRARPEIANIIRSLTYPDLKDHKSVQRFPPVRGLQRSITWIQHQCPESSADKIVPRNSSVLKKSSKINEFEADMVVQIVRYLGAQGYGNDHIVVITPYLAQVGLITKKMKEKGEFDVLLSQGDYHELVRAGLMYSRDLKGINKYIGVSTVDQFQGSDRDIVIVSMVRSNPEQKASFIRAPERANVLLSRARKALIVLGDLYSITDTGIPSSNSVWRNVFSHFKQNGHIFDGLPIVCQNHPQERYICKTPEDLKFRTPEGRCRLKCEAPLSCGKHTCAFFCHGEPNHSRMECKVLEKKTCSSGHEWDGICWTMKPQPCEKCSKIEAHYKAMQDDEEARQAKEFEANMAAERKLLKQAEESKNLAAKRQDELDHIREKRLAAQGRLPAKQKRPVPPIKPFGQTADRLIEKEQAERAAKDLEELDRRIEAAKFSSSPSKSSVNLGLRPLNVAELQERFSNKGSDSDGSSSAIERRDRKGKSSKPAVRTRRVTVPFDAEVPNSSDNSDYPPVPQKFRVPGLPICNAPIQLSHRRVLKESDSETIFEVKIQKPIPCEPNRPATQLNDNPQQEISGIMEHEQTIPSSPPLKIIQMPKSAEHPEPGPAPVMATNVSDTHVGGISGAFQESNHSVAHRSAIIEEPQTFINKSADVEGSTQIIVDSFSDTNGNPRRISKKKKNSQAKRKLSRVAKKQKFSSPPGPSKENSMPPNALEILETSFVSNPLQIQGISASSKFYTANTPHDSMKASHSIALTPFDGPFPSASRKEWQRRKAVTKDSNVALDNIMDMIGMEHVKEQVLAIKAKIDTVHRQGINLRGERFHIALLGNPGTGKTTFARLYAKFLRSEGVLEGASYIETTGARLAHEGINGLQGIFDGLLNARGGTLFIDEAYQLITSGAFEGRQVLDFLLSEMEKHLGKIIVIISGYNKEMEKFFEYNSGLHSRIPYRVQFEDFNSKELLYILQDTIKGKFEGRMKIEDGYSGLYMRIVAQRLGRLRGMSGCGNARGVQNAVAKILERQAARITKEMKQGHVIDDFLLTKEDVIGPAPTKAAMESEAWKELHQLIGLSAVKDSVSALLKRMEGNYHRELAEEKPIDVSLNRVFLGSPGTGKTSVAKIYGKILAQLGLLSSGEVVLKTPSDLLGRALGESEANTKAVLHASRGKVLIIDEAYMFNPKLNGADDPYKSAVIDTIVSEVQNVPGDDQCVLLLGYKTDLEKMFNAVNPGLSRRFPISEGFVFEDFTDAELAKILDLKLRLAEIHASPESREVAIRKISQRRQKTNFGNAGEVENLLSIAKERMLKRQVEGEGLVAELLPTDFDPDYDRGTKADSGLTDLFKDLIGVEEVIERFEEYQATSLAMRGRGIDPKDHISLLFIFKGPPGTGKTTTARKMGQIFYNMGFLATNEVVECSASDLVAEYVGQTAHRTRKKLEQGLGKVLFIDEAYRLQDNQYGVEASNELVDAVTKPQYMGKLVIILAGYDEGMDKLLAVNVGLASRFSEVIVFPEVNYRTATEIVKAEVKKANVEVPSLKDNSSKEYAEIVELLKEISETRGWGHARDALNLAKGMISKAYRAVKRNNDPVMVTHDIAVKVLIDMLKQRKGKAFAAPISKPAISFPPPRVQYQEPAEAPKVNINIEIEKVEETKKTLEASQLVATETVLETIVKSEPVIEDVVQPKPAVKVATQKKPIPKDSIVIKVANELPKTPEGPEGREAGTTDQDWETLTESIKFEQERLVAQEKRQSELRQKLTAAKKEDELATANHANTRLQNRGKKAPVFLKRIETARLRDERAKEALAEAEREMKEFIEHEKVRAAKEEINITKLDTMGLCPKKYHWIKTKDGYRCSGGEHYISNEDLNAFSL